MASHRYDPVLRILDGRQAACGSTKVVAVDGPSGAGKTQFAAGLGTVTGAAVLHLEDVYAGWDGLAETPPKIASLLGTIAVGGVGTTRRWEWDSGRPGAVLQVPPAPLLILDGVGSGAAVIRPHLSLLIWLEAPTQIRKQRALDRDGGTYAPYWEMWARQEAHHFAAEGTRGHADLIVTT